MMFVVEDKNQSQEHSLCIILRCPCAVIVWLPCWPFSRVFFAASLALVAVSFQRRVAHGHLVQGKRVEVVS